MARQGFIIHINGDVPRTQNGNVKVRMIAQKHLEAGETVEEIAEHYGITLADVHAALTYYYDHKSYFDDRDRHNQELLEKYAVHSDDLMARIKARMANQTPAEGE